jgi:outer membrane protein OmpA-like peptidoglycan-associated protein/tetratricopeptide (TPR) repeat protein
LNRLTRRIFIIIFIFLLPGKVWPQDKGEFRKIFLDAEYFFMTEEYNEALHLYSELLKIDPSNSNISFLTGACYLSLYGMKKKAIPYFETAVLSISPSYREGSYKERNAPRESLFALARAYHIDNQFDRAIDYYEKYRNAMIKKNFADIEYVNKQIKSCELAKFMINHPVEVTFLDLGRDVNRYTAQYNPVLSGNDSVIIYMADQDMGPVILMSERTGDSWSEPRIIDGELGSDGFCCPTSLSFNGKELYLVRSDYYEADIYVSKFQNGRWTEMEKLNDQINTEYYESHACISADGRRLYFTSDRPGGLGGLDIWVSERSAGGDWEQPLNLGKKVNSFYNEETPFITPNGQRLYFSSQGHATMGGYDIFFADRQGDATWSNPKNIGYPVSTSDDDLFFVPHRNEGRGYFSTIQDSLSPGRNIYALIIAPREDIRIGVRRQEEVTTGQPADTAILAQTDVEAEGEQILTDVETAGEQTLTDVEAEGEQILTDVEAEGEQTLTGDETEGEGTMQPVSTDDYYVLDSIIFEFDEFTLDEGAMQEANRLIEVMKRYPELQVELTGHTDAVGADEYNIRLSKNRAESVARYLTEHGISAGRITTRGIGEAQQIAINKYEDGTDSPEGRRLNRHVSIRLSNLEHKNIEVADIFVPEMLRPKAELSFSILLMNSDSIIVGMPEEIFGEQIALIITDKVYLYTAGHFDRKADAMRLLNEAIDGGFPDATMMEQHNLEDLILSTTEGEIPVSITFTIQIMALRKPVKVDYFRDLDNVKVFIGKDGLHRYVYSEFDEISEAQAELPRIRNMGYQDAFIMYLARYKTISAE